MKNLCGKVQRITLALLFVVIPARSQTIDQMVNAVSDSALFSTIAGLQGFGTRYYLAGNAMQVSGWLRDQFMAAGLAETVLDTFAYNSNIHTNVVATLRGSRHPNQEIIVGAHFDARTLPLSDTTPGADDDASGVAAILEIARVMASSGYRPSATIRFIGFAAEEPGLVGSGSYAQRAEEAGRNIILMVNFDMIGYTTSANPERRFSIIYYPPDTETPELVASAATTYTTLKPVMTTVDQADVDSYSFAMEGYTAVTCTEYLDNPNLHKPSDLIGTLDSSYTKDITRTGLATVVLYDQTVVSSLGEDPEKPIAARLEQNWPNPFNPRTMIKYTVGGTRGQGLGASKTMLVVYDLLGREVAVLVDERQAPGTYEVSFDGSNLASGVYVYRLTAGPYVASRKMLLVK